MAKDFLLMFLEKRIFTLKAGDDNLLAKLRGAVGAVVEKMSEEHRLVVPFVLIALDPLAPIDDPVFNLVGTAIQDQWNTYTEVFPEPRSVFRAVLLDALATAAEQDINIAGAADLICRNLLPHVQSGGETEIITNFRNRLRELAQTEAESQWPSVPQVAVPKAPVIKFGPLGSKKVSLDRDAFKAGFPMPPFSQQNWTVDIRALHTMIATSGADHIAGAIESAVAAGGISTEDLKKNLTDPLVAGINGLIGSVAASLESAIVPLTTLKRQSDLLWWKEAAYSEHLEQPYRSTSSTLLPLAAALDFALMLPPWSPVVTEHFLAEAVLAYLASAGSKPKKLTISAYIGKLPSESATKRLLDAIPAELLETSGRSTFLAFVADVILKRLDVKEGMAKTGFSPELSLSEVDLSLIFFREIQALRLLSEGETGDTE